MTTTIPTPPVPFFPIAPPAPSRSDASRAMDALLPRSTPGNDPPSPTEAEYRALLAHPELRKFLQRKVAKLDIPSADARELQAEVVDALWARRDRDPPATLKRLLGLAKCILKRREVDYLRHKQVERSRLVDAARVAVRDEDAPPEESGDPADQPNYVDCILPLRALTPEDALLTREKLAYVGEVASKIGLTEDDIEVMWALTYDKGPGRMEELAAERGMAPKGLRCRIERLRNALEKGWEKRMKRTLVLTLLLLALLVFFVLAAVVAGRRTPPP